MKSQTIASLAVCIILGVLMIDQISKWLANQQGLVSLNIGIAFGWRIPVWLGVVTGGVVLASLFRLGIMAWKTRRYSELLFLCLIAGGAISNLADRFRLGGVQDWLRIPLVELHNNIADWAIVIGCLGLLVHLSRSSRSSPNTEKRQE